MSQLQDIVQQCAETFQTMMENAGRRYEDPALDKYDWENHIYHGNNYRRGHVEVVDKRDTHGIYIVHATVFPFVDDSSPIWGFDVVCGKTKITGAFHDFSLVNDQHPMWDWFHDQVKDIQWNKPRELPEWARNIFSPAMVAAGNIREMSELETLINLGKNSLEYYLANVGKRVPGQDYTERQNYYCKNQKLNPHVYRSMIAMGVGEQIIKDFVEEVLFPELR